MFMRSNKTKKTNAKIKNIQQSTEIKDIRSLPNFEKVLANNPHAKFIQGYYIEIPLSDYQTFVPNAPAFPDRYGKPYTTGKLDAPLFDLHEWRDNWQKGHPQSEQPDLLINANWFNVWESGIPNVGKKLAPRKQDRTFLMGLSISNGTLVSLHTTLGAHSIGLDTIIFDEKTKQAELSFHHEIDKTLGIAESKDGYNTLYHQGSNDPIFKDKNAVSGFIIMKDGKTFLTPEINNNHNNRVPRTGIGLKENGKVIVVLVIHNTNREYGVTVEEFAKLFTTLNCEQAINLDNSGSVELYYKGLGEFGKKPVAIRTKTSDKDENGSASERPKPNCLGFKNICNPRFFAADDSEIIHQKTIKTPQPKDDEKINYLYQIKC